MHPPLRDATIAYFCVVESTSGDLAGVFALMHTEAFAPFPRLSRWARRVAPNSEVPMRRSSRPWKGADPSGFFVSGDAPQARVGVAEAIVTLHEPVYLAGVEHAIPAPRKVVDRE